MSKEIEFHHPPKKGLNLLAKYSLTGVVFLSLCLFGYFYVSLFTTLSLGFFWVLIKKLSPSNRVHVRVSSAGLYVSNPFESLFFPWFAIKSYCPCFYEGRKVFKLTLKNNRPGLDFQVNLSSTKTRLDPLFEWQRPDYYFFFPLSFWDFFSVHAGSFEAFQQAASILYREAGSAIDLSYQCMKRRSCVVDVTKPLVWPSFCPYSGEEVDSLLSLSSKPLLSLAISKKGYQGYKNQQQGIYWLFLLLPSLANLLVFAYLETTMIVEERVLAISLGFCLALFPLSWIFVKSLSSPVEVKALSSKKVELHFLSEDYFHSFLQANLQSQNSVAPLMYQQ